MSVQDFQITPNPNAPRMPRQWFQQALRVFSIPASRNTELEIGIFIVNHLKRKQLPYTIDPYGNILVTKGEADDYPCFCAHLDTVHSYYEGFVLKVGTMKENGREYLFAENHAKKRVGVGGDDKCGIFVCLYLLEMVPKVKIVFFSSEETGGQGSNGVNLDFFKDCKFVGSVDRWNGHDFIDTYMGERTVARKMISAITPIIKRWGLQFTTGLFTDAFVLWERGVGVSCFNISCGYYRHHTTEEYVDVAELWMSCLVCRELAMLPNRYPLRRQPVVKKYNYNKWQYGDDEVEPYWESRFLPTQKCPHCGTILVGKEKEENICWFCKRKAKMPSVRYCKQCGLELMPGEQWYCNYCNTKIGLKH